MTISFSLPLDSLHGALQKSCSHIAYGKQRGSTHLQVHGATAYRVQDLTFPVHVPNVEGWTPSSWQERRASGLCCSTSSRSQIRSGAKEYSTAADEVKLDQDVALSPEEVDRRIRKAAALMATADELAPFDRKSFNPALLIWGAIGDIPAAERPRLLNMIMPQDIKKLWKVAGERYLAGRQELALAQGPDYSLYDDFPEEPEEVTMYEGRAAVPLTSIFGGFRKLFFLQPRTFEVYGRVQVRRGLLGPLGDLLYPLYYKCSIGTSTIPGTSELSDVQLEYLNLDELGLQPANVPSSGRWPHIQPPRWPFSGGLVDYLRAVGPGVYVGVGWKQPGTAEAKRFLYFMLVKRCDKS